MGNNGLPPLQPTPNLSRLLAPEEEIIYTAKLHPFYGFWWLGLGLLAAGLGLWLKPLWLVALVLGFIYLLPFRNFEMAVTTRRLLVRQGRFGITLEGILGEKIVEWHIRQHLLQTWLHAGTVTIRVEENKTLRTIALPWLWHPMTFIEALETLQLDHKRPS